VVIEIEAMSPIAKPCKLRCSEESWLSMGIQLGWSPKPSLRAFVVSAEAGSDSRRKSFEVFVGPVGLESSIGFMSSEILRKLHWFVTFAPFADVVV